MRGFEKSSCNVVLALLLTLLVRGLIFICFRQCCYSGRTTRFGWSGRASGRCCGQAVVVPDGNPAFLSLENETREDQVTRMAGSLCVSCARCASVITWWHHIITCAHRHRSGLRITVYWIMLDVHSVGQRLWIMSGYVCKSWCIKKCQTFLYFVNNLLNWDLLRKNWIQPLSWYPNSWSLVYWNSSQLTFWNAIFR